MWDISSKTFTLRTATAQSTLRISPSTKIAIEEGRLPKGDPFPIAKVAAIQAAKNTSQIIPYCHPLPVEHVGVEFEMTEATIETRVSIKATYKTGVEVEAITAATVAALTLYDMLKMIDDTMEIGAVRLIEKKGGKNDYKDEFETPPRAAVLVISDTVSQGKAEDRSGAAIRDRLIGLGVEVIDLAVVPDDRERIVESVKKYADDLKVDLVITTGGTGLGPRDVTPEALVGLFDRELPGVAEAVRDYGQRRIPLAMLSRSVAGVRGSTVILSLPGSKRAVEEGMDAVFPALLHSFRMMQGCGH